MNTPEIEEIEIELLLDGIVRRYGYDFRNYLRPSLTRRIRRAVELEGAGTVSGLQERVLREPACMARLVSTLSVRATTMFRDPLMHHCLRAKVIPILRTYPFIRIWHAGCSTGEEVYSLAITLHEEGLYERCRIYATDIAGALIDRAAAGVFPLHTMRENTRNYQRAGGKREFSAYYTTGSDRVIFRRFLSKQMVFSTHNLVSDGRFNEFNLILCRNVMIYFDAQLRRRVHRLLYDSLSRFGFLNLGSREVLESPDLQERYIPFAPEYQLYRKVS